MARSPYLRANRSACHRVCTNTASVDWYCVPLAFVCVKWIVLHATEVLARKPEPCGAKVTVVPPRTPVADVMEMGVDGVLLANGPGDPEPCDYAIATCRELIERGFPTLGICLGHQIMGLAAGGKSLKMKFGHHGANHPVQDIDTGEVLISSQNHGFAIDEASLPDTARVTHRSLFDGSLQGIEIVGKPVFSFQGHPEASPGPHDVAPIFQRFIRAMDAAKA